MSARDEIRAERDAEITAWLGKKAREYRSTTSRQHALQADALDIMASKISRGAVRDNNTATLPSDEPLIVDRFDTAIEPAPEDDPLLTICAIAAGGRPVALLLDEETRAKVARWCTPYPRPLLTAAERRILAFALDLAFNQMVSDDEFTEEDHAALNSLGALTTPPVGAVPDPECGICRGTGDTSATYVGPSELHPGIVECSCWDPTAEPVTIPPEVAEHVLWHEYRDPAGYPPGGYLRQLLTAWSYADDEHSRRLAAAYPAYGAARDLAAAPDGRDRLRQISAAAAQGGDAA
ncbi:hypothetical protein [Streptomyces sp. NPDC047315]|uniref:hypothetical protein n=1 Tax=Streptomyces sp. NPDC047315 TaxID=3155142 RepID=UPI0033F8E367